MPTALAWHTAHDRLKQLTLDHRELLGAYAASELPDIPALQAAAAHADSLHRLAPDAVMTPHRRTTLAAQTADSATPAPELLSLGVVLRDELGTWAAELNDPSLRSDADELIKQPLGSVARRLRAHLAPLREAIALLDTLTAVGRRAGGASERTVSVARAAVAAAHKARRETAPFAAEEATHRRLFGPWYGGLDTDPSHLRDDARGVVTGHEATGQLLRLAWEASEPTGTAGPDQVARAGAQDIELLGRYAPDGHPDSDLLRRAIETARTVEKLAAGALADPARRARLAEGMTDGRPEPHEALRQAERIRSELEIWQSHAGLPHLSGAGHQLLALPLDEAARWFRAHVEPFEDAADLVHSVARVADTPHDLTLGRAREAVTAVVQARAAAARFTEDSSAHRGLLGELYRSTATNRSDVLDALDWAQKVRRTSDGAHSAPLTPAAAHTMLTAPADPSVAQRHQDWRRQRDALAEHFQPPRDRDLRRELQQSLSAARTYLSRLDDDPYGPEAWTSCAQALTRLKGYGLDGLPGQLAQRDVSAAEFPAAMERAVLTAWIERRFELDARLKPMRAVERDQLVERFRMADRDLVEAAHADVIAACNDRRPRRTSVGQAAVLRRQAQLKSRHMPVRRLLGETREVVRLIKPCFMMSPLTVSQFLPSDFRFDVVIFDEASQVLPQDAVNSIYRGDALIVAGDQKQLPPTSFFSAGGDSDEDDEWDEDGAVGFESVLDACKASGVLRGLPLRWHYRSRHENLIAFSNHEFYDNTMVTFPGALEQSPDVGVEFIKADGVYDKGGRSNNPLEAARVAQRVIHHFPTRPGLTLGVVALSKVQAEAIEEAVQKARAARPDLDRFFTDDRLDGFFVKNLETVQGDERDVIILSVAATDPTSRASSPRRSAPSTGRAAGGGSTSPSPAPGAGWRSWPPSTAATCATAPTRACST
ncbi:DEAD/DEAH box helicase [Streptomyces sp. NPDC059802]|uniref:DEAD/DEAH box helicase n=1 Tax=Streptomyces sp. NPDC059802 TaxID=3346952 RepID=UPI003657E36E